MHTPTLGEMAAAFKARSTTSSSTDAHRKQYFRIGSAPIGSTTQIRLLPDKDEENFAPYQERQDIRIPFCGATNSDYPIDGDCTVVVPCARTWGKVCQIQTATRHLWKGSADEKAIARLYYPKKSFLFQGFVVSSPVVEAEPVENPNRLFAFSRMIFDGIKAGILEPEFDDNPLDYEMGHDLKIVKGTRGGFASYQTTFSGRSRSLNDAERKALDTYGLWDLATEIGPEPDKSVFEMTSAMFADSLAGEPFDARKYSPFRAFAVAPTAGTTSPVTPADNSAIVAKLRSKNKVTEPVA